MTYIAALEATWPAAATTTKGIWTFRDGQGGGKRVSAITTEAPVSAADLDRAEAEIAASGCAALFSLRPGQGDLDALLQARGYALVDPTVIRACPVAQLTDLALPKVCVFNVWEPLAIQRDIWQAGGIGPERQAVMARVQGPKTALLARFNDHPGGAGFVAIHDGIAMVHALEILPHQRRQGLGAWMMRGAALWAQEQGAHTLALAVTEANVAANALYSSLGMTVVEQYHYRLKEEQT